MIAPVTKAVFPVAGMGTRFLPATKANPKEMLPIVDKPLIQYAVEEAVAAGITELIFVTSSSKRAIEDHFDSNYELEAKLAKANKQELLTLVRDVLPKGANCAYVRQPDALGLGHAVLCAQPLIGNEPFAVLLADDLIDSQTPCLKQMVSVFEQTRNSVIAVEEVPMAETERYGIVAVESGHDHRVAKVQRIVEKPPVAKAPSNLAVVGRYILDPAIFTYLSKTAADRAGEIQLTDAIAALLKDQSVMSLRFAGKRYDCGSKLGYLQATIAYALKHPELENEFSAYLNMLSKTEAVA
jgi:UTP--glucose-1-phosphate uridylyltransferase